MRIIVGLGNPGRRYQNTRHNFGFMVIDELARKYRVRFFFPRYKGRVCRVTISEEEILLLKPYTYMNRSGESVARAMEHLNLYSDQLIVVHDDLDLELGQVKINFASKSAGHKGVESIISELGTDEFYRVRLGIGRPEGDEVVDYVLSPFSPQELEKVKKMLPKVVQAVEILLTEGLERAQNFAHRRD